ncbi:MAG: ATP-binding protein, partial [Saprospiraceae bacterium]|nr:ATP-binding protein [Saprospiraceae bacterium]
MNSKRARIIVLTGPESTGKTTLCRMLAEHYKEPWVPEFAREYLHERDGIYSESDLREMAKGHLQSIYDYWPKADKFLFVDTDLWNYVVWANFKYGRVDPFIDGSAKLHPASYYLLCGLDPLWEEDPLREN